MGQEEIVRDIGKVEDQGNGGKSPREKTQSERAGGGG